MHRTRYPGRPKKLSFHAAIAALLFAGGCSAGKPAVVDVVDAWAERNGSVVAATDHRAARLDAALRSLDRPGLTGRVDARVLGSDDLGAFAWPNGRLFVTRGLVDLLDDQELAAAVAHELGHLLADGRVGRPAALAGVARHRHGSDDDVEVTADREAVGLLRSAHVDPAALTRVLQKLVTDARTPADVRASLRERVRRLAEPTSARPLLEE